jgi:medium-chain acyl-[acyl-carrier-protein] hydrolase
LNDTWFVRPDPNPAAEIRFFCFHAAGFGASMFVPWNKHLRTDVDFCIVQLPGRESRLREQPFNNVFPLIDALENVIYPLLDKPFALFGYSMGSLIAFELARRLRQSYSLEPEHLFFSSRRSPDVAEKLPLITGLDNQDFINEIQKRFQSIPQVILNDPELLDLFLPTLRADFSLLETYSYHAESPFQCPITVMGGANDRITSAEDLDGWNIHTYGTFEKKLFLGGHFFHTSNLESVIQTVKDRLFTTC